MKLIVGLGNPGQEYEATRHNIGFKVIDLVAHSKGIELNKEKFTGVFYKGDDFILAKPMTFMNLSGDFVQKIAKFFKINVEDILVIYDDMDLATGTIRYREVGSSGGQNGMKDIIEKMGTDKIKRLKIGIGRPKNGAKNWVLGTFTKLQLEELDKVKDDILNKVNEFINK